MIQQTKLEYKDFSGGITENFIPGRPNMYAKADNLWITRDFSVETRWGSRILEGNGYLVPTGGARINEIWPAFNDSELLAVSASSLFYQNPTTKTWTLLTGIEGGQAFPGNLSDGHVAHAEWRSQVFMTPSGMNGPQKVYRDNLGAMQLRQAGLPIPVFPLITDGDRFNACVTMAVAIRSALLTHFAEAGPQATANTHILAQPSATLTALTTPTTNAQLAAYINTLRAEFTTHVTDAQKSEGNGNPRIYHLKSQFIPFLTQGLLGVLNISLNGLYSNVTETSSTFLLDAVKSLNDLKNKYNFHTYATVTHGNAWIPSWWINATLVTTYGLTALPRNTTGFGRNAVLLPDLATTTTTFTDTGIYDNLIAYVNAVRAEMTAHQTDYGVAPASARIHTYPDYDFIPFLPAPTTLFDCFVNAAHCEWLYWLHWDDSANRFYTPFTGTLTATSNTMTSTSIIGSSNIGNFVTNQIFSAGFWQEFGWMTAGIGNRTTITGGTVNTVVTLATSALTGANTMCLTNSSYHFGADTSVASATSPTAFTSRLALVDFSMASTTSLITELQSFIGIFKAHEISYRTPTVYPGPTPGTTATVYSNTITGQTAPVPATTVVVIPPHRSSFAWPMIAFSTPTNYLASVFDAANAPVSSTILYTVVFRYPYKVGIIDFLDVSSPAISQQVLRINSPNAAAGTSGTLYPTTLTNIPKLTNIPGTNYDTANIKVDIYRTIGNGTTFYLVGTINNGVTTFVDNVTDTDLITKQQLYTTGGTVPNDPPPAAKYITILNNTAYYGNIIDSGQYLPYRVRQSIQNDPDSCPATFYDDLDDTITGLSNFRNYVVAFCSTSIYRLENGFNELGQGFLSHERITDTIGCVSHASIVRTELGIFFCGTNGIYWTDGYTFQRLTQELDLTYNALISTELRRNRLNGVYMKDARRVIWNFVSRDDQTDCDISWALDLNFPFQGQGSFTTLSGGTSYAPSSMAYFGGRLIRADARGYVFAHEEQWKSDPYVDTAVTPTSWRFQPVIYDFESCATDFGTNKYKKWATRITMQAENMSNASISIQHKNDNNFAGYTSLTPIRYRKNVLWGTPNLLWNDAVQSPCQWGFEGMIDDFRRFEAGSLRCDWKSVRFTNATVIIQNSDTYGLMAVSANVAGIVTLTLTPVLGRKLPRQAPGNYSITFLNTDTNEYTYGPYPILTRADDTHYTIAFDATVPVSTVNRKWIITGIPLDERMHLTAYNITYAPLSDEQRAYQGATSTGGGANK